VKVRTNAISAALAASLVATVVSAQAQVDWSVLERARTNTPKPTATAISAEDLRTRLFIFADDSMRGRELGDRGNVKGTAYIASELKRLGLEPAGDNGGYLQQVPVVERVFDDNSHVSVGDMSLAPWKDYVSRDQGAGQRPIDGVATVYGGVWGDASKLMSRDAVAGKVVVITAPQTEHGGGVPGVPTRGEVMSYYDKAAAIVVAALDNIPAQMLAAFHQPLAGVEQSDPVVSYIYVTKGVGAAIFGGDLGSVAPGTAGKPFKGNPTYQRKGLDQNPGYNVVGIIRGSDATLRNQFVAIGAHNDHIGMEQQPVAHDSAYVINHLYKEQGADSPEPKPSDIDFKKVNAILADVRAKTHGASARLDSVYNGADDDGTGSVSLLELAEYFAGQKVKPKRSLLFIWHVGEEEGLFGSEYFTDHPTVPRDAIVTELNMDMVGRGDATDVTGSTKDDKPIHGGENYVQIIGSHRLSTELGDLIEKVNTSKNHKMTIDYALDADGHPQQIYCRSDHYEYARYGIPIAFFTTGGHADYHQLTDEPQYINYAHMTRVVDFVKDIAVEAANLDHRLVVNKPKPDPKGVCRQ
jgi:hypothetical protein